MHASWLVQFTNDTKPKGYPLTKLYSKIVANQVPVAQQNALISPVQLPYYFFCV
jgi:hypothetical protein